MLYVDEIFSKVLFIILFFGLCPPPSFHVQPVRTSSLLVDELQFVGIIILLYMSSLPPILLPPYLLHDLLCYIPRLPLQPTNPQFCSVVLG
jgi:hypothetical protein